MKRHALKKKVPTLSLRPSQFSMGLAELKAKALEIQKLGKKKRRKLVAKTPVPVVIAPGGELHMIDHHHFVLACCYTGISSVHVTVVADWSKQRLSHRAFWKKMERENFAYLYDQFGEGPKKPLYLPVDVRGLADDPYRSLAWAVRDAGAYRNSKKVFAEFEWADFFRARKLLDREGRRGFKDAVREGILLARSRKAARLPGYAGAKTGRKSKQMKKS